MQVYDEFIARMHSQGRRFDTIFSDVTVSRRSFVDRGLLILQVKSYFQFSVAAPQLGRVEDGCACRRSWTNLGRQPRLGGTTHGEQHRQSEKQKPIANTPWIMQRLHKLGHALLFHKLRAVTQTWPHIMMDARGRVVLCLATLTATLGHELFDHKILLRVEVVAIGIPGAD